MAKPRVFLSSTFYDLRKVRDEVGTFIRTQGFEPVMFERGQIAYGRDEAPVEYCYKEIELCDILVSIVGGRFGSESFETTYSVSQQELRYAVQLNRQLYVFVDKQVLMEYEIYKINKEVENMRFMHVDDRRIYEFLDQLYLLPKNNPIFPFESAEDIIQILREQWAGLFQRMLLELGQKPQADALKEMSHLTSYMKQIVTTLAEQNTNQTLSLQDLLFLQHPAFTRVRELLQVPFRFTFTTMNDLDQILNYMNFTRVQLVPFEQSYTWTQNKNGTLWLFRISKNVFDSSHNLRQFQQDDWDDGFIQLELSEIESEDHSLQI